MRDSEIKILLKGFCEAPDNMKKDAFIRSVGRKQQFEKVSFINMLAIQACYIRKRVWIISILLLAWAMLNISGLESEKVEIIARIMPFFACFGLIEGCRAKMHEMSELEGTTLFSAKGAYFAKMAVIAMAHFFTIVMLAVLTPGAYEKGCLIVMARLLIPYIVTSILSMEAERSCRSWGKDNEGIHIAIPFGVALAVLYGRQILYNMHVTDSLDASKVMMLLALVLVLQTIEVRKTVKLEELIWN